MKTDYIKQIITMIIGLAAIGTGGGRLMAQTTDTAETGTYSKGLSKAAKADPIIGDFTKIYCVGEAIDVTANITGGTIDALELPKDTYWSGGDIINQTATSITKRFYTYHPYTKPDPETESKQEFTFKVTYNGNQTKDIRKFISAKSCPPDISKTPVLEGSGTTLQTYHNLGYIRFEFSCKNPTAKAEKTTFTDHFDPSQYWFLAEVPGYSKEGWLQFRYRCIPVSDAAYTVAVQFNEGDSLRTKSFGPYTVNVIQQLNAIKTDKPAYCTGDDIVFTLELPKLYSDILQQTTNGDESNIASCFDWTGSPSVVTFDKITGTTCTFKTKAAETTTPYQCKMSVELRYKATSNADLIRLPHTYDLTIDRFTVHSAQSLTQETIDACEGTTINLEDYLSGTGLTIDGYTKKSDGSFTRGPAYTVPGQTETITVKITSGYCGTFEPDLTVNVTPQPYISALSVSHDTLICEGEPLRLAAEINPEAKATVTWTKTQGGNTIPIAENELDHFVLQNDAAITIEAVSSIGCGSHSKLFNVRIGPRPTVQIIPNSATDCPGRKVSLKGDSPGSNCKFQLRDVQGNTLTPPELSDAFGLDNYTLKENDDLILTYTADQTTGATGFVPASVTCAASTTAPIKARPLPEVQITYDGQAHGDGATLCVPRNEPFTLSASGTDTYAWSKDGTGITTPDFKLTADAAVTVRGTDKTTTCSKDITVQCVVSVNAVGTTSETICPGDDIRFAADDLPDTKYVWRDPKGNIVGDNSYEYQAADVQPGQEGKYTLNITRSTCTFPPLTYQLAFHPYPKLKVEANNPACQGDELVINYLHGLPASERPTYSLKRADGSEVSGGQLEGDRVIYRMPDIQPAQAGTYTFTIASSHNCTDTDITEIEVDQPVAANMVFEADQTTFCEDEATMLTAEALPDGDYTYKWRNDARTVYEGNEARIPVVWQRADNGTLYLEIIQRVCRSSAQKDITVIPRPHLSGMPQDTGLCDGMPLCLNPVADLRPDQITWFFIGTDGQLTTLEQGANPDLTYCWAQVDAMMNGRYFVDAAYQGCIGHSDTMSLTVYPLPDIRIDGPTFICDGDTVTLTAVSETPGTNRWSPSGQTTEAIKVTEAGRYAVTRTSTHGCANTAETSLEARPRPYFSLADDTSFCRGTSFLIYGPDGMDAYLWNDGSEEKDRLVEEEGWYILTVFRNECPFTDSLFADETFCGQFHFPTAFTPNDNRVNDTWGAISAAKDEDMAEFDLMVFDRNGKKVFHGKRLSEQWDGYYKGQLCPPGVYTYSFRALEKEEGLKYQSSGTVTIVL